MPHIGFIHDKFAAFDSLANFDKISEKGAQGTLDLFVFKGKNATIRATIIFILPHDVEISSLAYNERIKNKGYAMILYTPLFIDENSGWLDFEGDECFEEFWRCGGSS